MWVKKKLKTVKIGTQHWRGEKQASSYTEDTKIGVNVGDECHLSSFRLVFDILCGTNLGLDILEVRQWLVDDAQLLRCGCR